jgi:rubrerythrin
MLAALYLLYRIAYPKQAGTKKNKEAQKETSPEKSKNVPDVMGKSRYVAPDRSQPVQTPATSPETEKVIEKENTFAAETEEKRSVEIPVEQLDEVFGEETNREFMSIPLETENENNGTESDVNYDAEEEAEELNRMLGREPEYADGIDYDDLRTAAKVVSEQPSEVSEETAATLEKLEHTDMFEWLVSGDEGKANWIKAVVERNIPKTMPEDEQTEDDTSDADYGDFVAGFLS